MKVYFKNGKSIEVSKDEVKILCTQIMSDKGSPTFQIFANSSDLETVTLVINVADISYIK